MSYALATLAACTPGDTTVQQDAGTFSPIDSSPSNPAARPNPSDTTAVEAKPLLWDNHAVVVRLSAAGLRPEQLGEIRHPFLGVPGLTIRVAGGAAEIHVFIYGDAGAVARDTKGLDSTRVAPPTMQIMWIMPPSLVVDNNLAVIVLTRDEALRSRVRTALTARPHGGG